MPILTRAYYYKHYPEIQQAKYEQAWAYLKGHIPRKVNALLDLGVGYAWLEVLLKKKKLRIKRIMGVDVDEQAIGTPRKNITYILDPDFEPTEKFEFVICWDAWHCFPKKNVIDWVKPNGLLLVAEPKPFESVIEHLVKNNQMEILVDEWVGDLEKSRVVLARKRDA